MTSPPESQSNPNLLHSLWGRYRDAPLVIKLGSGFIAGLAAAAIFAEDAEVLAPLGELFLRLLQMIVVPIVLFTLIAALGGTPLSRVARVGPKTLIFYIATTLIAATLGLAAGILTQPGQGLSLPADATAERPELEDSTFSEALLGIIPENIFTALAEGDMLAIIFLAIVAGLALSIMKQARDQHIVSSGSFLEKLTAASRDMTFKVLDGILQYAPLGVFGLAASTLGGQSMNAVRDLGHVLMVYFGTVGVHMLVVYGGLLLLFGISIPTFLRTSFPAMLTALSTGSSSATLPVSLRSARAANLRESVSGFVLPLGATINMDGAAIRLGLYAVLAANVAGEAMPLATMVTIVFATTAMSIGAAAVPGAGPVILSLLLLQTGLPLEVVGVIAGLDLLLNQVSTMCNITGDLTASHVVDKSETRREAKQQRNRTRRDSKA